MSQTGTKNFNHKFLNKRKPQIKFIVKPPQNFIPKIILLLLLADRYYHCIVSIVKVNVKLMFLWPHQKNKFYLSDI